MISNCKRILTAAMTGVMLLSSASCGMIEIRDSTSDIVEEEETTPLMLDPAERKNTVETRNETEIPTAEEPAAAVTVCLTGDIRIDDQIIRDAANRATEGKSYSFVRMYTGVFRNICSSDIAMGSYSAADIPVGSDGEKKTPVESLAALSDVGFDVLETSGIDNDSSDMEDYGILDIDTSEDVRYIEKNGLDIAFLSLSGEDTDKVAAAAEMSDALIVSMNWSENSTDADREKIAYSLALAGADVIVGDGNTLGGVEWIDIGDGSPVLVAYSLGNLIATSDAPYELCGGILEFTVSETENVCKISGAMLSPSVVRYTEGYTDYQLVMLQDYGYDLSSGHAVSEVNADVLLPYVRQTVTAEFLNPDLRG